MYQSTRFFIGAIILLILASCSSSNTLGLTVQPHNSTDPFDTVGEVINYSYVVTNTGTTTLKGPVLITDDKMQVACPELIDVGNQDRSLDPGENVTCTSTYTIIQADLDAGSVNNNSIAKVSGTESNRVSNIVKTIQTFRTNRFTRGMTIQHIVVPGEWLWQIARCYGADPNQLMIANPQIIDSNETIDLSTILDSMILTVPNIGSSGTIYGPPCITFYTVVAGDTWQSIAMQYDADPTLLMQVNMTPLSVGIKIMIPLHSSAILLPAPTFTSTKDKLAFVDSILKMKYTGSLTYITPVSMNMDTTFPIELYLTPSLSEGEVNSQSEGSGLVTPTAERDTLLTIGGEELRVTGTSKIDITSRMKAVLYSADQDAFDIQSLNIDDEKVVGSSISTKWQWVIKSRKTGHQEIILVIYRLVKFDDVDDWREVEIYKAAIDVKVTFAQRVQALDWKWLAGFILASVGSVLGVLTWLNNQNKGKKKKKIRKVCL